MWTIGLSLQSRAHCSDLIFQKCSETLSFFNHFKWKPSSRYSLVHLLPTSSSKSAPRPSVFIAFSQVETELALQSRTPFADWKVPRDPQCFSIFKCKSSSRFSLVHLLPTSFYRSAPRREIELSLQCCAHFVGLIFQKCFETLRFFNIFKWKSSSRFSPVHFLSTTFPDRAAQLRKQRHSFGDHRSHFTRKNTGFRDRECFQSWTHAIPISHISQLLAWWCGCHDDWGDDAAAIMMIKLTMTIVRNSGIS